MKDKVWIVQGSTGEYSDHCEWVVAGFYDEQKAQRLVVEAQARANEIHQLKESSWEKWYELREKEDDAIKNEFDPQMQLDYTGTHYICFAVEIKDAA